MANIRTSTKLVLPHACLAHTRSPLRADWRRLGLLLALGAVACIAWYARAFRYSPNGVVAEAKLSLLAAHRPHRTVLECFQVAQPVAVHDRPVGSRMISHEGEIFGTREKTGTTIASTVDEHCSVLLMTHVFAWSYGKPFVGNYFPPACSFNRVIVNLTVVSEGRQFDRLALMFLNDTEVWRTSTAEPVAHPGIRWSVIKDMTHLTYLWRAPQRLIFDLGNLVDGKYTGTFNATLTAAFLHDASRTEGSTPPADMIVPVSMEKGAAGQASHFSVPRDRASASRVLPRNMNRAVFSISANGQAEEEFWWSNVLESDRTTFAATAGTLPALSPFREVQLLIDGRLAGVSWPFPVIFTGGVTPSLHRPIVGLQAFDLREHQIDITPWLPLLCDGAPHEFHIRVAGLDDDGVDHAVLSDHIGDTWYVTGKIFLWLDDDDSSITTGTTIVTNLQAASSYDDGLDQPIVSLSRAVVQNATGFNQSVSFQLAVRRALVISGHVQSQRRHSHVVWTQQLEYANAALVSNYGFTQVNDFNIRGSDTTRSSGTAAVGGSNGGGGALQYEAAYEYPLYCNQSIIFTEQGDLVIRSRLREGLELKTSGHSVFPTGCEGYDVDKRWHGRQPHGAYVQTRREGTGEFFASANRNSSSGFGSTNQVFYFGALFAPLPDDNQKSLRHDGRGGGAQHIKELYFRNVTAVNGTVVASREKFPTGSSVAPVVVVLVREEDEPHEGSDKAGDDDTGEVKFSDQSQASGLQLRSESEALYAYSDHGHDYFAEPLAVRRHLGTSESFTGIDCCGKCIDGCTKGEEKQGNAGMWMGDGQRQQNRLLCDW